MLSAKILMLVVQYKSKFLTIKSGTIGTLKLTLMDIKIFQASPLGYQAQIFSP